MNAGIELRGKYNTTNLQLYGTSKTSTSDQDIEVFVTGGVLGQRQQGDNEIYSKLKKQFCDEGQLNANSMRLENSGVGSANISLWSTNHYDCCNNEYQFDANKLNITATKVHIGYI